jgi:hypothetical protein
MNRIINGATYDTETDLFLAHHSNIDQYSEGYRDNLHDHLLQMTKDGQLYVFHLLRPDDDCIEPLTHEDALQWVLKHDARCNIDTSPLDELFPTTMVVSIRMPKNLWQRHRQAIRDGRTVPVNGLVVQLLEQELEKHTAA